MVTQNFTTEELANETWEPIPDWADIYQASSLGRVRRIVNSSSKFKPEIKAGAILNATQDTHYLVLSLTRDGKSKKHHVHRLVAAAFIGPLPKGMTTNHKNGIKQDNRIENLEYVTHKDNLRHAKGIGLLATGAAHGSQTHPERVMKGETHVFAKLTEAEVRAMRAEYAGSYSTLARKYGVHSGTVRDIILRHCWKHV